LTLSDNQTLRQRHPATIIPMPRRRIPILIVAAFPSRSPRYKVLRKKLQQIAGPDFTGEPVEEPAFPPAATTASDPKCSNDPARVADDRTAPSLVAPIVVRPRQACEMLSIGLTRLYELLNDRQLESFRHGRGRRITTESIRAYIDRHIEASPKRRDL
jgi:excisionase family DNA binding protein